MSQPVQFNFGVEIETRTSSKSKKHNSWLRLAKEVSQELTKKGIPSHIIQAEWEKSEEKYQNSLELVSPVLSYSDPEWLNQINTTWSVLDAKFDVEKGLPQTSTHVHLSPISDGWTIGSVRNVALAAVFFERSIDSIVPVLRRANIWCQSNRHNANLQSLKMPEIFKKLNSFNNIGTVVSYMNTMSKNSLFGKERLKEDDFKCRYFRWNLTSCESGKGTIEIRQAPGSECKENTLTWITLPSHSSPQLSPEQAGWTLRKSPPVWMD
ncbi:hypothetical protein VSDG_06898 [Cytospora chrysosperma]|uniref:GS catalytic domain-containing protein n=1 Tax=Cytospora chrysosperma TaxID=252740 RepID=A0A423VQM4_CYTCH|nr:hypothetical protein VSDG_06898 [Valsa sordida]